MSFIKKDFLLRSLTAQKLYFDYAEPMPIFDFHCHLIPEQIATDKRFDNITELWLGGDHYKWRLMRFGGVAEKLIMGDGDNKSKFMHYCKVLPSAIGNPVYHWSHLELLRFFDIEDEISIETAEYLWEQCNKKIASPDFSAQKLMLRANVNYVCTSDDPVDDLKYHQHLAAQDDFRIGVFPTYRPDKALAIDSQNFIDYVEKLAARSGIRLDSYQNYCRALSNRIDFFHQQHCRMSDHGLDLMRYIPATPSELEHIFEKALNRDPLSAKEVIQFRTETLCFLASRYAQLNWTMQIHIGAMRSVNSRMLAHLGRDCGYDSPTDRPCMDDLVLLLNRMEQQESLPDTLLFSLNPTLDSALATLAGNFPGDKALAKVQPGPAWWHNDHKVGMENQLTAFGNALLLGHFIGMTTDSRSFLSYPRHEYFRRILCNFVGDLIERGEYTNQLSVAGGMIQNICYFNAERKYFKK